MEYLAVLYARRLTEKAFSVLNLHVLYIFFC